MKLDKLFWLVANRLNKAGKAPLYLRVYVNTKRTEISTGIFLPPDKWDAHGQRMKGASDEARQTNRKIMQLAAVCEDVLDLIRKGKLSPTAEKLRRMIKGEDVAKLPGIIEIFDQVIDEQKRMSRAGRTPETMITRKRNCQEFLQDFYKVNDVLIDQVGLRFVQDMIRYFKADRKHSHNYVGKNIEAVKRMVEWAYHNQYIPSNPLVGYKFKRDRAKDIVYLTEEELSLLVNFKLSSYRLEVVRDVFVFCCYTGLAYADVSKLSKQHIMRGIDKKEWLSIDRTKTGTSSEVPLLDQAKAILEKYADNPEASAKGRLLPIISNNKTNLYIGQVIEMIGINKEVTFHVARKTFAMMMLNNGASYDVVSKMLGHSSVRITEQAYAKIKQKRISAEMEVVKTKLA